MNLDRYDDIHRFCEHGGLGGPVAEIVPREQYAMKTGKYRLLTDPSVECQVLEVNESHPPRKWVKVGFGDHRLHGYRFEVPLTFFELAWEPVPTPGPRVMAEVIKTSITFRGRQVYLGTDPHCGLLDPSLADKDDVAAFNARIGDGIDK